MGWIRAWRVLQFVVGTLGAVLMAVTGVSPEDAVSNFSKWADLAGLHSLSPSVANGSFDLWIFWIGAALLLGSILAGFWGHSVWNFLRGNIHPTALDLRSEIKRDVWLQDALYYAAFRRWGGAVLIELEDDGDIAKVWGVLPKFRELAGDGKLIIWGKTDERRLHEAIPADYWLDHQLETFVLHGEPKSAKTEKATGWGASDLVYIELMCSKAQVEALCRAGSI